MLGPPFPRGGEENRPRRFLSPRTPAARVSVDAGTGVYYPVLGGALMGKEVVYCFNCGVRLLYSDFEKGAAYRVGTEFSCSECMPLLLEMMPPEEREKFLSGKEGQRPSSHTPRRGTGRVPLAEGMSRKGTTRRSVAPPPEEFEGDEETPGEEGEAASRRRKLLILAGAGSLAAVLLAAVLILALRKKPAPEEEAAAAPPAPVVKEPPRVKTPEDIARELLDKARKFQEQNPGDLEGQIREFRSVAWEYDRTAAGEEANREVQILVDKLAKGLTPEMEKLLEKIQEPLEQDDFKKALEILDQAKEKNATPAWILQVDKRIDEVRGRAEDRLKELKQKAAEALGNGDKEEVARIRDRVSQWGLARLLEEFDKALGPPEERAKKPETPEAPKPAARTEEGKAYLELWMAAAASATARDYAAAARKVQQASRDLKEDPWKREAADDLKDLKALEEYAAAAVKAAARIPLGTKVSLSLLGGRERIEGAVVGGEDDHLEIQREGRKDVVFVDPTELAGPSLVQAAQAAGRAKPADLRLAALLLLLEGEAEEAKKINAADVPEKYWDYARGARENLPKLDSGDARREREAKLLFWGAERDYSKMETLGAAIDKYKTLAKDYVATSVVSKNIKRVTLRSEAGKDYFLLPGDLKGSGAVQLRPHPELESVWTCQEDIADPGRGRETFVEIEFWALPDTPYQCWIYAGACCLETFVVYLQATDMTGPNPRKTSEKISYDVGSGVAAPLEPKVKGLKKTHAQHGGGEKTAAKWDWVPVPLPKYPAGGLKKIRLMTENKGFSVAMALVTSVRKAPPKDEEVGEERKRAAEEAASRKRGEPALVALWTFDEQQGDTVEDRSGRGNKGTLQGGPQWAKNTPPEISSGNGGSLKLDSKDDFVQVPSSPSLEFDTASFTVSAWVCLTDEEPSRLINKWDGKVGWLADLNADMGGKKSKGMFRVKMSDGKETVEHAVKTSLDTKGKRWGHVAMVVDRGAKELRLYVNGVAQGGPKGIGALGSLRNSAAIGIGCIPSSKGNQMGGFIDEVRIYARALSSAEIAEVMNRAAGR